MPTTVTSLEDRVELIEEKLSSIQKDQHVSSVDLASFKAKVDTVVSVLKWIGVFVAGLTATTLFNILSIANTAGRMEATVAHLRDQVTEQRKINDSLVATIHSLEVQLARIEKIKREP